MTSLNSKRPRCGNCCYHQYDNCVYNPPVMMEPGAKYHIQPIPDPEFGYCSHWHQVGETETELKLKLKLNEEKEDDCNKILRPAKIGKVSRSAAVKAVKTVERGKRK